jgi:hypothetical protein
VATAAVEGRKNRVEIGLSTIGYPALGAAEDVIRAILFGQQLKARDVRARIGLGKAE